MNNLGREYIKTISRQWATIKHKPSWGWVDSAVQERIMRLGREAGVCEIDARNIAELEAVAIATLREDYLKKLV